MRESFGFVGSSYLEISDLKITDALFPFKNNSPVLICWPLEEGESIKRSD